MSERDTRTRPFSKLTPAQVERLALLAEECGEVVQVIGKVLRHGYTSRHPARSDTNRNDLEREMGDLRAAMIYLCEAGDVAKVNVHQHADDKLARLGRRTYLHHQGKRP